jgi:hypothetical protein
MSKQSSPSTTEKAEPQVYRKPQADVYTVMLSIALIVIILATVVLWRGVMKDYNYEIKGGPNPVWHRPAALAPFDAPREVA